MATARQANEDDGNDEIGWRTTCKWETNALSKIISTLLYYALITERLSLFYFGKHCLLDQTGTGHQKGLAEKAKPVLKRAYARTKMGTRSETGSARTSTGLLLIRVLTYVPSLLPLMLCIDGTFITTGEHHGRRFAGVPCLILANKHN